MVEFSRRPDRFLFPGVTTGINAITRFTDGTEQGGAARVPLPSQRCCYRVRGQSVW